MTISTDYFWVMTVTRDDLSGKYNEVLFAVCPARIHLPFKYSERLQLLRLSNYRTKTAAGSTRQDRTVKSQLERHVPSVR